MKRAIEVLACAAIMVSLAGSARALEVNFAPTVTAVFPMGAFAESEGIIHQAPYGWSASGGGANTGFGFNLEIETRLTDVIMMGFRFGYVKHNADAAGVERFINDMFEHDGTAAEVSSLDASWTHTFMSFPIRAIAQRTGWGETYLRFDIGWVKIKNSFDGEMLAGEPQTRTSFSSDYALGSHFFLAGGGGVDFDLGGGYSVIAEIRYNFIFPGGADATASVGGTTIRAVQDFNPRTLDIVVGLRIPLSGV
jgi:hypothetical protein